MTLSGATTPSQSEPGSDGNEGVLCIPQSSSITGTLPSDCLVSYLGHSLGGGLTLLQTCRSVYSTARADWAISFMSISFGVKSGWLAIYSCYYLCEFFISALADDLSLESKWQQVSLDSPRPTGLLVIMADLNFAAVWRVSIRHSIFNSSSPTSKKII